MDKKPIAVFISGRGSNLKSIIDACKSKDFPAFISIVISDNEKATGIIIKGLDKKGFLQPDHKRKSMIRNINNIFHRLNLSEQEIRILLGIFTTLNEFNKKTWIDKLHPLFINHVV